MSAMRRLVLHLFVLHVVVAFIAMGASPARSHWDQPHQVIGGLTRIMDLPEQHRKFFIECRSEGSIHGGLTSPDERRDSAFLLTRLSYVMEHQKSADRSQMAYQAAAQKYAEAVRKNDRSAACQAISQLSESIHYLQDAADATKNLNNCRQHITRLVSSYIVKQLSSDNRLMNALRTSHDAARPTIAPLQVMPPKKAKPTSGANDNDAVAVANHLLRQRDKYTERINGAFDKYNIKALKCLNHLSGRDDDLVSKLDKELPHDLRDELISAMIDMFGLMWAAQDHYAWQFVHGNWYLITAMVIYREGRDPEMRCVKTIKRVVETGVSEDERKQALERVRQEIKSLVTTGQVNYMSVPVASVIITSNEIIDQPDDSDPKPKCDPVIRALTSPLLEEDCPLACSQWKLQDGWQSSDGRNNDCCPYPEEKRCIDVRCTKDFDCALWERRCDGGVPKPPPGVSPSYSPGYTPGGGVHLGPADPGVSIRPPDQGVIITTPPTTYLPPPAPLYIPPPVYVPVKPPVRTTQPPQTYVRPPQVQTQTEAPPIRYTQPPQTYVRPPQVQTQTPQQGASTRPPQEGVSTGVEGTRTNQVNKPPCRCLRQEKYWYASDGRHKTCCPNPQQKRCIATKCEQRTRCLQWGPPGCVR
jgi:hypothetical protein